MLRAITAFLLLIILASAGANAQGNSGPKARPVKSYWLKYSLIFLSGCYPRVYPDNITFDDGDCLLSSDDALPRGTQVEVMSIWRGGGFASVSLRRWSSTYEVLLSDKTGRDFGKSFDLLLSEERVRGGMEVRCPSKLKMKKQVIKCYGFPMRVLKDGDVEGDVYNTPFVGFSDGFEGWTVRIKNNKVLSIEGSI